jgi:hypothetical protein
MMTYLLSRQDELAKLFAPDVEETKHQSYLDLILLCLQNFCEGDFKAMKDYMREQNNNTLSFNIIKEVTIFLFELERSFTENVEITNQLFRTLTEFSGGCQGNQVNNKNY